jgi:hypothetical protein
MRSLAAALGWPVAVRALSFRSFELLLHAAPFPTLLGVYRGASDALRPPWPDLVITAGRRNELPALWIRERARRDGRVTPVRVVHVGRPWTHPDRFDLVVSNRQYALDPAANVVVNDLPLHEVDAPRLEAARAAWSARLAGCAAPRTAVLVGGSSGPLVLTPERAAELGRCVERFVSATGGSVLVTDSPRTPAGVLDALVRELRVPAFVHRFGAGTENPYLAFLASADAFVVTADSASMVAEAASTARPVYLFDFSTGSAWRNRDAWRWRPLVHRLSHAIGPRRMRRDVHALHARLVESGRARWFDDDAAPFVPLPSATDELARTAERVRALLEEGGSG